ncbi:unnamed protein product [Triticum aestivum]|uniref:Reverse transcriptase domain-containing protein n=1 Tax=Triticum aestivum TaxID=4565 RepID=A0A7H4LK09_WHEAT|nr:unnamed protein product [Triticum aestivum]
MEKLSIKQKQLQPSRTVFHGIVPGLSHTPIGKIKIDVLFGDKDHFRRELVWFEVVDLDSPYHALLGRPALAKFMAVPHYAYLKMKMPSTKGFITISGDYKKSSTCAAASSRLAESLVIAAEKRLLDRVVAMAGKQPDMSPDPKESEAEGSFKPAKETKKIPLDPEHPESLKKACPKDPFALPRIDQVIDSTAGCELLSFLDAYSGYHQIKLNPADRLKTSFIAPFGAFCYLTMMFGLRNAGATFQRCMQKCFLKQLSRNAHVYVDDVVVKTEKRGTLLEDLKGTFENLRRFQIKLNPENCVFGVPADQLLGFLVSKRGIECNPVKIKAIERMELKKMLTTMPVLAAPAAKEPMLLYIAATNRVVSTVIVVERKEDDKVLPVQRPAYYLSEEL